jgi:hypothetical protein
LASRLTPPANSRRSICRLSPSRCSGAGTFALAYDVKEVTDLRANSASAPTNQTPYRKAFLTPRGRFAWAHDFEPDRSIAATFQALPGASFVVNGAAAGA